RPCFGSNARRCRLVRSRAQHAMAVALGCDHRARGFGSRSPTVRGGVTDGPLAVHHIMRDSAVVITGIGIASPLGSDFASFSANLLAGTSVARPVCDERAGVAVRLPVCTADDHPVPAGWSDAGFCRLPRSEQFAL